jgi:hypothetical protein
MISHDTFPHPCHIESILIFAFLTFCYSFTGANTATDVEARGGGLFLSGVVPGTSGEETVSKFVGWQIVSINDFDLTDGCTDTHLRAALTGADGRDLVVGFVDNPELIVSVMTLLSFPKDPLPLTSIPFTRSH